MPSKSTKQQGLMGQAYAIRKFQRTHGKEGLDPKDVPAEYRDEIKKVSKQMKLKSLKDFASTSHKGLPEEVEEELNPEDYFKRNPYDIPFVESRFKSS
jgi:hypothetical protein